MLVEDVCHVTTRVDAARVLQVADVAGCAVVYCCVKHFTVVQTKCDAFAGGAGAWLAVSPCPFYPEGGGQVGDTGHVTFLHEGQLVRAAVKDCKKVMQLKLLHNCSSTGTNTAPLCAT